MGGESGRLLRLLVQGDKEIKSSVVNINHVATLLPSSLTSGQTRKGLLLYASGEVLVGGSNLTTANGFPVPNADYLEMPVNSDLGPYFISAVSGESPAVKILEIA